MNGLGLSVIGQKVLCRPSGALWLEAERALIVADLHLEKGSAYAARGQLLPPYDTGETLGRVEAEAVALDPRMIVLLGDSLHDHWARERLGPAHLGRIAALAEGRALIWIVGNHDLHGLDGMPGETLAALELAGLTFIHEPSEGRAHGEIAGHLHPCARVAGGVGRRRCFVTDGERMILPAFGAYAGGLNVRDAAFRGLFSPAKLAAVLGRDAVHPVSWKALRGD